MIFVSIGSAFQDFSRLIKRVDKIAPKIKEKIIVQTGFSKYIPKNCESFKFSPSFNKYYKEARLIISHGASSAWEFMQEYKKPAIIVPRQARYKEHINDHQVNFCKMLEEKIRCKVIYDMEDLTPRLLKDYKTVCKISDVNLKRLKVFLKNFLETAI